MRGEIGFTIRKITLTEFTEGNYDMTFYDDNDGFLHICGDNDLKTLLTEALENIKKPYHIKKEGL